MANSTQKIRSEIADEVFYGIPSEKERKKMSPRELAKLLSECEKNTPKFILIEHELNIRIVKEQSKPAYLAVVMAIVGVILGWLLSQWQPFISPTSLDIIAKHIQSNMESDYIIDSQDKTLQLKTTPPIKPENATIEASTKKVDKTIGTLNDQKKQITQQQQN